jgi:hypothetical protein
MRRPVAASPLRRAAAVGPALRPAVRRLFTRGACAPPSRARSRRIGRSRRGSRVGSHTRGCVFLRGTDARVAGVCGAGRKLGASAPAASSAATAEQAHPDPFCLDPLYRDPFYRDPFYLDPFYLDPFYLDPFYLDPFYLDPFYLDPFDQDPFDQDPLDLDPSLRFRVRSSRLSQGCRGFDDDVPRLQDRALCAMEIHH